MTDLLLSRKNTAARRRLKEAIQLRNRLAKLAPAFVDALAEKALDREFVCPLHGPVGHAVDPLGQCRVAVNRFEDDEKTTGPCGESCTKDGPLMASVKEIGAAASLALRTAAVRDHVLSIDGLEKKTDAAAPSAPVHPGLSMNVYVNLTPQERIERIRADVAGVAPIQPRSLPIPTECVVIDVPVRKDPDAVPAVDRRSERSPDSPEGL